jgi:hypothetical protein
VVGSSTSAALQASTAPHTRLQAGIRKRKLCSDGIVRYAFSASSTKPHLLQEALSTPCWKAAMHDEYVALMRNKTWHLVPLQADRNVIDCKWVYKVKHKAHGSVDRYKVWLVAKAFKQRLRIDYDDTFSLVKHVTI